MKTNSEKSEAKLDKSKVKKKNTQTARKNEEKRGSLIRGVGKNPNQLTVQKSNPLYGLWRSELSLAEFKIIDTYLSRIDSHDPARRTVRLEKGEIEQLLGVKKINRPELEKRLKNLGTMVPIDDPQKKQKFRLITLFECAECEQDDDGVWQVDLTCTPSALKYIFNIENLGYLRYKLRTVTSLQSRYSYILFLYLEKNRHMHLSWEISVDELRMLLKADSNTYQEFKRFNDLILKPAHKEITEKTECGFTYESIKMRRKVKAIRFTLKPLADEIEQTTILIPYVNDGDKTIDPENKDGGDEATADADLESDELLVELSDECNKIFNAAELQQLKEAVAEVPRDKLPLDPISGDKDLENQRFWYFREKYEKMCDYNPDRRFRYLLAMIKHDAEN